jgi:glyoxylase-like metal-dependent hydrolase (beta-lactamase superfamily II)
MDHNFKELTVLRRGASNGDRMVIRIVPHRGVPIHAVSVPRAEFSHTGPTWAYLFENEGLTLIDAGEFGSFHQLDDGLKCAGFRARDIQRVIVTHGHEDHDGSVAELVAETGAEVWAHEIYAHLQAHDPRVIQRRSSSPIQEEFHRVADANEAFPPTSATRAQYIERRKVMHIDHQIQPGEQLGNLSLIHAPGHSPDELCMKLDGVVFTGDHVLPEISPHPTMKTVFAPEIKGHLPAVYQIENDWYGLATYLKSLKLISDMGEQTQVLPAHRYFNRDKFNYINALRARDIIEHHGLRLGQILNHVGTTAVGLEPLTRGIFDHRKLMGINLRAALAEVVAHIELLEDTGDLEITDRRELIRTGTENYREMIQQLTA